MPNNRKRPEQTARQRVVPVAPPGHAPAIAAAVVLLRQAFGGSARVDWEPTPSRQPGVAEVTVRLGDGKRQRLYLLAHPAAVALAPASEAPGVPVFAKVAKDQRAAFRARKQPFVDLSGAVYLPLRWATINVTDLEPVKPATLFSPSANPFNDKSSLVLRVMLEHDVGRIWGVRELATMADVAPATASDCLRALASMGLIQTTRAGRAAQVTLRSPRAAIDAWTRAYDWRLNRAVAFDAPVGSPQRFLATLPAAFRKAFGGAPQRWALTLQAGASLVAPHAAWDRLHVYVDVPPRAGAREQAMLAIGSRLGWTPSQHGKVVLFAPYYTASAWHGMLRVRNLPVVSKLQLVLDLWHYPLRGQEQAEHLMTEMFPERMSLG